MARILVVGSIATVELAVEPVDGGVIGTCVKHSPYDSRLTVPRVCAWTAIYDDMNDATEYAAEHADEGKQS
jgi:hypothetical protein